jgi:hypothetical protein
MTTMRRRKVLPQQEASNDMLSVMMSALDARRQHIKYDDDNDEDEEWDL